MKRDKILIVDDSAIELDIIASMFDPSRFDIVRLINSQDALTTAISYQPDLIILDLMMPDFNGADLYEHLKLSESTKSIPVLFVTGESKLQGVDLGPNDGVMQKPCKREEFNQVTRSKIARKQLIENIKSLSDSIERIENKALTQRNKMKV